MIRIKPLEEIVQFLRPIAEGMGIEIVDAAWDGRTRSLTLYVDTEGGIDLIRLEAFHRAVDEPLDELDPTYGEAYTLNCSSPGLDRPFKTERDFMRQIGEKVEVRLYAPIGGKKYYEGTLLSYENGRFRIAAEDGEHEFEAAKTAKVCLLIEV